MTFEDFFCKALLLLLLKIDISDLTCETEDSIKLIEQLLATLTTLLREL